MTTALRRPPPPKNANEAGHRRAKNRKMSAELNEQRRGYLIDRAVEYLEAVFGQNAAEAARTVLEKQTRDRTEPLVFDDARAFEANDRLITHVLPNLPARGARR